MNSRYFCTFFLFFWITFGSAQGIFSFPSNKKSETVKFKLSSNLIIIPVEVNGTQLSFILDSGIIKPILFNLTNNDSLEIKNVSEIELKGLGGGHTINAYRSTNNSFKIGQLENENQHLYIVIDQQINFSPWLGETVHGMIGYDFFKDFIVDINYDSKKIKLYRPEDYVVRKCKKCETFNLEMLNDKPFINTSVVLENRLISNVKLLIDSGNSEAITLFKNSNDSILVPKKNFEDFLGFGLSGPIYGYRSRLDKFNIGKFSLENVKVAFPDSVSLKHINLVNDRNGSLGGEILRRYRVVFNYRDGKITLKKSSKFKDPFKFNMSGIELQHNSNRFVKELETINEGTYRSKASTSDEITILSSDYYKFSLKPVFEITEIRNDSPADLAGLKKGDIIISVNGNQAYKYSLQEIMNKMNEKEGKTIRLYVERNQDIRLFVFKLEKIL